MISKLLPLVKFAMVFSVITLSLVGVQMVNAQFENSDIVKIQCEKKYSEYKKSYNDQMNQNSPDQGSFAECLNLFEDPLWDFKGKDKIDKDYNLKILKSKLHPLIKNFENQNLRINNLSFINIGFEEYAVKIRICADNKTILEPKFFVVTNKEYYLAMGDKQIKENSCSIVWTYASSSNPDEINFIPFNGNYMPSKYMKIKSIY